MEAERSEQRGGWEVQREVQVGIQEQRGTVGTQVQNSSGEQTRKRRQRPKSSEDDDAWEAAYGVVNASTQPDSNTEVDRGSDRAKRVVKDGGLKVPYKLM